MIQEKALVMNFDYTETQHMVAAAARDFAEQYIRPFIMEWDEAQIFPVDVFRKAGELGFMGVLVPEQYGGSGLGYHEYIAIVEEISKVDPSIWVVCGYSQFIVYKSYFRLWYRGTKTTLVAKVSNWTMDWCLGTYRT